MSEVRKKEAKEAEEAAQEERRTLALEQIVTQLKGLNEQLKGLKKIKEEGHLLRSHFEKVVSGLCSDIYLVADLRVVSFDHSGG